MHARARIYVYIYGIKKTPLPRWVTELCDNTRRVNDLCTYPRSTSRTRQK